MQFLDRRDFLQTAAAASMATWTLGDLVTDAAKLKPSRLKISTFRFDVTPPEGHSLCGGWIKPVIGVDDPLEAMGIVISGVGKPVVLCAVDWTGLLNEAHIAWRTALAEAAGTTPDRVAVQCVHQHNAPFACLDAERFTQEQGDLPHIVELDYYQKCLERGKAAVKAGMKKARLLTHIATGQGKVEKVASNRRVYRDENGMIKAMRGSSCRNPKLRAMPEGLIDPWLKTVAFYDGNTKVAAFHYYATHPMSYYGDGLVSSDFAGLARKKRQADEPGCLHVSFTGCSGNIAAGKYNDGSKEVRPVLTQRVYDGIVRSEEKLKLQTIESMVWRTADLLPTPRASLDIKQLESQIRNKANSVVNRNRPSFMWSWLRRLKQKTPIVLSSLELNNTRLLHLPAECFIEYQLRAQEIGGEKFVATAAYGDGGPWYIPVKEEYTKGGYEVRVAFSEPSIDDALTEGMRRLVGG